ncbi:translation initiation factor IF-2-like [Cebus imitator]|uniref:translation initiation factor IF-2-like n=1 Tax=Cebus imitator TaxID=2715852 RepID=UPI001898A6CD|nr:translation initiation factor IF-2-like [Cebus imitator]
MARLPGLGRWRGESALPPLLVRGGAGPVAFPGDPESSSAPAPRRPGQAASPQRRTAARADLTASSSRAAPRRGASLARHPAPLTRSHPLGACGAEGRARKASRGEQEGANAGSATRAAPLPQRRRRPGPCCCCQLVERTLSMRARGPHPGNFRVWPFSPAAFLSPGCPRLPSPAPSDGEGRSAQALAGQRQPAGGSESRLGAGPGPRRGRRAKACLREWSPGTLASLCKKVPKLRRRARR